MAFTRDDLVAYEQQPQENVHINTVTAPAATEPEPAQPEAADPAESSAAGDSDQPEAGDATSDDNAGESSTSDADADAETVEGETEGETPAESETESTDQPPQKQSRAFKRIQELNAKALEASDLAEGYKEFGKLAQEQLKAAREEIARLKAATGEVPAPKVETSTPSVAKQLGPMPKLTDPDVNFDPDILAQKVEEWTEKKVELSIQAALRKTDEQSQVQKVVNTFQAQIEDFKKSTPDWEEKVKNPDLPRLNPAAQSVVVKSGFGPQIVYHLANNIEEAKRIAALPPEDQVMEMGVLKRDLELAAKAKQPTSTEKTPVTGAKPVVKKSVSQATPPPTPVPAGKRSTARDLTDPTLDMEDFARRHREAKNNARLAKRQMRGLS